MRWGPIVAFLLLLLAGCTEPATTPTETSAAAPRRGTVVGLAVDDEARPVGNVTILIDDVEATATDDGGRFVAGDVPEGRRVLAAVHAEYEPVVQDVFVLGELEVQVKLVLVKVPALRPYNYTLPALKGHYDCAAEYFIVTGDCGILFENVTCTLNYCQSDPVWSEKYQFRFDVPDRWETIIGELVWEQSGSSSLEGMRLYLENGNISAQGGHGKRVARVDGAQQPLTMRYERGVPHPGAENYDGTTTPAFVPAAGGQQQFRVFPMGKAWENARTVCYGTRCLLGVGAAVDVSFTLYITIFVNEAAPSGFSYAKSVPRG